MEWLVDASGCRPEALTDMALLQSLLSEVVEELDLRVLGQPIWHQFPGPAGVTGLILLSESHLTCHTYPEHKLATFNLYCCLARPAWPWNERLREKLGAAHVYLRSFERATARESYGKLGDIRIDLANTRL